MGDEVSHDRRLGNARLAVMQHVFRKFAAYV
jgi:hypothetical protein